MYAILLLLGSIGAWLLNFVMLPGNWLIVGFAALYAATVNEGAAQGITWEVVLAAEMISGGGQQAGGGLGFFIWSSYMGGSMEQVIIGMISIGIAGYLSSSLIRYIGYLSTPWQRLF